MSFGVYVHVPFCIVRCDYCDFATWSDRSHLTDDYVDACVVDLGRQASAGLSAATSVFFGGGTPSLLPPAHVARVLDAIDRVPGAEVTVECNPDSVNAESLRGYRAAGVTRLSIGVQSTQPHVLAGLGRTHRPDHVANAVALARDAGFVSVGVDLIYGTAGESLDDWRRTLDEALALGVDHVSAYALTVEVGTPLARRVTAGEVLAPDDDDQAEKYLVADEVLSAAGLGWYEVSNWSRPGHACAHNLLYWRQGDYLAVGCAAHGHRSGRRWWNVRTPERYVERIRADASPEAGAELLDPVTRAEEALTLALRTRAGAVVDRAAHDELAALAADRLVETTGSRVVLTLRGRLMASDVTARLLLAGAATTPAAGTRYD